MYEDLLDEFEDTILEAVGYKVNPDEATDLAKQLIEVVRETVDERLSY